jgi:flagellar motor switch protein FliM
MDGILGLILKDLEEVWRQIIPNIRLKKEISENSPHIIQIVSQNEVVILVVCEVKFGDVLGMMNLCIPAIVLEPVLGKISSSDWLIGAKKGLDGEKEGEIMHMLADTEVPTNIYLGHNKLTIEDILDLKDGDLIMFNTKQDRPVEIHFNNKMKFLGEVGTLGVKKAVKITQFITESEDENPAE